MKKLLIVLLFIGIGFQNYAQDTIPDKPDDSYNIYRESNRFHFGGFASPDLSYSIIPRNTMHEPSIKNYSQHYDINKFSVTVGLEGLYQINELLSISIGFQYSDKGGRTDEIEYYPTVITTDPVSAYYVYDYRYIDIPLRLDFYITRRKVSPFITAGVSTNILVFQKTSCYSTDINEQETANSITGTSGFSRGNPQFQVGAGIDIALNYSRLRIFPIYRMTIADANLGSTYSYQGQTAPSVKGKLYSIGLGINYLFRI